MRWTVYLRLMTGTGQVGYGGCLDHAFSIETKDVISAWNEEDPPTCRKTKVPSI